MVDISGFFGGRERRFYMSEFKHLLGGEQRVIIGDSETVFLGFMVRLYKLGVIGWVDIEVAADRFEEVKARLVPRPWRY
jgi:sugar phosphate isomerase/epimerase